MLGGSLTLFSDARGGDIRLIRRPNVAKGEPLLTDAQGRPLDPALWERLLGGVTREVYASVYGFSLSELQSFASLTSEGVRNALYGASFGMAGLKSPGAALKKLTGSMEDLFRARGSNPRLSAALKEWEDVRRDMRRAEEDAARYDSLAAERDAAQGRLAALREERAERERERRVLERRLGVWERWEEWRLAGVRLERLEPVPATFPQDGPARLERALERRSDAERALEQARQRLEQAREDLGSRVADRALLDCGERLRELAGRAASCRNALAAIPGLCADRERTLAALQRELAGLGPDWTAERVQRIGRPLSLREALERQAEQRRSAVSDMENAQAAVRRIAEDTKALESELEEQMRQAADVPEPPMALSEAERERLREAMARAEEARRRLPEAQTSSAEAERELDQALSRLALEPGTSGRALEALSAGQDAIAALASEILHKEAERKDRERRVAAAGSDAERAGETLARLRERRAASPARSAVDAQWAALRRLRSALSRLAVEHVRFTDAESRCAEHGAASGTESSPALVVLGSVLAGLGVAGAVLRGVLEVAFLRLGSVALPLEGWLLGAFLLVGGAFVWAGFPRRKERRPEFAATAERLQQRRTACLQRVQAVLREIGELCRTVGLSDAEEATVDAFERAVELARERCAAGERLAEEIQRQEAFCAEAERHAQTERAALEQASADERAAMARWLAWFQTYGVDAPLPGEAAVFCARVDSARMRLASALAKRRELAALEADRAALPECVRSLLSEAFYSGDDDIRAAEAARNALELCREADRLCDERRRLEESVQAMTLQLTRLEQSRLGAEDALEAARARQVAADAAWEGFLVGLVWQPDCLRRRPGKRWSGWIAYRRWKRSACGLTRSWSGRNANAMPSVCRFGISCGSLAVCRMPARTTQRKSRIGPDAWKRCCANGSPPVPKTPRLCVSAPDPKNRPWKSGG
ncbi:MAG: AAA family ATPase [Bilophila wadsworthia]